MMMGLPPRDPAAVSGICPRCKQPFDVHQYRGINGAWLELPLCPEKKK